MTILSATSRQEAVNSIVISALERSSSTKFVGTTKETFAAFAHWMKKNLHPQHIGVIFDSNTRKIAHENVLPLLRAAQLDYTEHCAQGPTPHQPPICSTTYGEQLGEQFPTTLDLILSVGSGTVTDLGKIAARKRGVPLIVIATAASMNGFTSALAATLDDGLKLTKKTPPPYAVWGHPETLASAPSSMSSAGLGDLHSKPISSADWRLSHRLNGTPWDPDVVEMLQTVTHLSEGLADGLHRNDPEAHGQLFAGLCLTGIAMQAATPGSQASGAEHLISHYFDMIAGSASFTHRATDHGAQVAVGCMVALCAWSFAQRCLKEKRPMQACPAHVYEPTARKQWIDAHFRDLSPAISSMHERTPVRSEDVERRRAMLDANGVNILEDAASYLPAPAWLRSELQRAQCPTYFQELGVSRSLAAECLQYAPWVRARYTILHLLLECGWYDDFMEEALAATYEPVT